MRGKDCTERRVVLEPAALTANITRHMYMSSMIGLVVVIIDRPRIMLSVLRKQWAKLTREVHRCRAGSADAENIIIYSSEMLRMHTLRFSCESADTVADIIILDPSELADVPKRCRTLYICSNTVAPEVPLPRRHVVIDYRPVPTCGDGLVMR